MPMTALPAAPSTSSPSDFAAKADALLAALPGFVTEANALEAAVDADKTAAAGSASAASGSASTATTQAGIATTKAGEALASANAAAASASAAAGSASTSAGWSATSTTSMALTAGAKTLTIQTGKQFTPGTNIKVKRTSDPAASHAFTTVTTYDSGTGALAFTLATDDIVGSGTYTDWTVELSGPRGATGATGATGTGLTAQAVGFTATAGTTPKTLTVDADATVSALISAGGLVYLSTVAASASASVDVETTFDGTFDHYVILADDIVLSAAVALNVRLKLGGSYVTANYLTNTSVRLASSTTETISATTTGTLIPVADGFSTNDASSGALELHVSGVTNTSRTKNVRSRAVVFEPGDLTLTDAIGTSADSFGALTGIRFLPDTGTITSGNFRLYGIKKS